MQTQTCEIKPPAGAILDTTAALNRFLALTAIPGPSGQEQQVADAIVAQLKAAGVPDAQIAFDDANLRTPISGGPGNLIVRLPGTTEGPTTLLSAHMDTVPVCVGSQPAVDGDYARSSNPETGLGADNRSGCAAILSAAVELLRSGRPHPPLVLCWFVQEEIGLQGSRHLDASRMGRVDRAVNFDGGTVEKLTVGAIGGQRMTIVVRGIAAHAGVAPQDGASAIVIASRAIADLDSAGWLGAVQRSDGSQGTANVGVFQGGDATNVVTPRVLIRAEARSHDAAVRQRIVDEIRTAFERAAAAVTNAAGQVGSIEFHSQIDYEAFRIDEDSPCVIAARRAIEAVGREPVVAVANGGLDANWLFRHGIAAVTLGCGQRNVHTAAEQLCIPDYLDACRIASALAAGQYT